MLAYFNGKSLVSKLIKWRTWGKYSHVGWIVDRDVTIDFDGEPLLIPGGTIYESWHIKSKGAARNGFRKGRAGTLHKPGTPVDLYRVPFVNEAQHHALLRCFERMARDPNARYAFRAVITGFMLRKHIEDDLVFCSESMMLGFDACKLRMLINVEPKQVSPVDLSRSPVQHYHAHWLTGTPWIHSLEGWDGWR